MSKVKDLIKKDLDWDFSPQFQDLNKGGYTSPAATAGGQGGGQNGGKPPAPPMSKPPTAKTPKMGQVKSPRSQSTTKPSTKLAINKGDVINLDERRRQKQGDQTPPPPQKSYNEEREDKIRSHQIRMHHLFAELKAKKNRKPKPDMKKGAMDVNHPATSPSQDKYHIYHKGQRLTEDHEAVTLDHVNQKYGGVRNLESKGYTLVPHKGTSAPNFKSKMANAKQNQTRNVIKKEVMNAYNPKLMGDIKELAKSKPWVACVAVPYSSLKKAAEKDIVGVHVPNKVNPPPTSKKVPGNKDEGSGGKVSKEEKGKTKISIVPHPPEVSDDVDPEIIASTKRRLKEAKDKEAKDGKTIPANKVIKPIDKDETDSGSGNTSSWNPFYNPTPKTPAPADPVDSAPKMDLHGRDASGKPQSPWGKRYGTKKD